MFLYLTYVNDSVYTEDMTTATKDTNMKNLTIAVDLDNTSFDYEDGFRKFVGELHGITAEELMMRYPVCTDYTMGNNGWFNMETQEKFIELHAQAVENGLFEKLVPYEGVSEALWDFHRQGHFIRIVTARFLKPGDRYRVVESTARSLDDAHIPVDDIAFTSRKTEVLADVYIDDAPKNIHELTAAGRTVIIFDQPYNQGIEGLRAKTWKDVTNIINELAQG